MEEAVVHMEEAVGKCILNDWNQGKETLKQFLKNEPGMR